ncbi:MAG: alpha-galactosidase [Clostridia bacterium]|nr:alpha-galactosidase [Clostridia bacterium]
MKNPYFKIEFSDKNELCFSYRSGMMVYEEVFSDGMLLPCGYNASGYPLNVLQNITTRLDSTNWQEPSSFNIELDGQSVDFRLRFVDFTVNETENSAEGILTLESELKPVRIKMYTIIDGTQMFSRYFEIENLSSDKMNLSRLCLLSGGLENIQKNRFIYDNNIENFYSLGYFENTHWAREGLFTWRKVTPDTLTIDSRFLRDRFRHPLVFLKNNVNGLMYFSQIAYSGGCRFSVDYNATREDDDTYISLKAEITSYNPLCVIEPYEKFRTPEIHMGVVMGGLDEAVNEMHSHTRKCLPETNLLVGFGMGAEHDMSVECTKDYMRQAAEMGAEVFLVDAGWYCPPGEQMKWGEYCGDNFPHPDRYHDGIKEISDYCHKLGMKFCMWADIENMGNLAKLRNEKPEWFANDIYGRSTDSLIDMTNPEAVLWCENELARMIEEYNMDMLRVDNNGSFRNYYGIGKDGDCLSLRRFNVIYKTYDNLKKRFPDVIFENCAGGGGRTDLGLMRYFSHTWVSDNQRSPYSVMITNGMTMALPPEKVDRLFAGMGCHDQGSFDLHMRNTMLGHMSLNTIAPCGCEVNPIQMEFVKHSVEIYKNFIRGFLPQSKIYHHTPDTVETHKNGFSCLEIASECKTKGVIAAFTLVSPGTDVYTVFPKGINVSKTYAVTFDNSRETFEVSGRQLMTHGINIRIPTALSSELVIFEEVEL